MPPINKRRRPKSADTGRLGLRKRTPAIEPGTEIDYKDCELLRRFMTERGKMLPRRLTGATAKQQRQVTRAIRRARTVGLVP